MKLLKKYIKIVIEIFKEIYSFVEYPIKCIIVIVIFYGIVGVAVYPAFKKFNKNYKCRGYYCNVGKRHIIVNGKDYYVT